MNIDRQVSIEPKNLKYEGGYLLLPIPTIDKSLIYLCELGNHMIRRIIHARRLSSYTV
jgi:hypothetical protein